MNYEDGLAAQSLPSARMRSPPWPNGLRRNAAFLQIMVKLCFMFPRGCRFFFAKFFPLDP